MDFDFSFAFFDLEVFFALLLIAYLIAAVFTVSSLLIKPPHYAHRKPSEGLALVGNPIDPVWQPFIHDPKTDFGLDYESVEFPALPIAPGVSSPTLRGWYLPRPAPKDGLRRGIVMVHGGGRDRREFLRFTPFLAKEGYELLLFDCREHGISDGSGRGFDWGRAMVFDVLGAVHYAKHHLKWDRLALQGVSNGAVLSVLAAAYEDGLIFDVHKTAPSINALIIESPYRNVPQGMVDIMKAFLSSLPPAVAMLSLLPLLVRLVTIVARMRIKYRQDHRHVRPLPEVNIDTLVAHLSPRPALFIHGTRDNRFPTSFTEDLYAMYKHRKLLWIVPFGHHTECYDADPALYEHRERTFLRDHL